MSVTAEVMMPGPLHPDLFDEMTPIMVPAKVGLYTGVVSWVEPQCKPVVLIAPDMKTAEQWAKQDAENSLDPDACEIQVELNDPNDTDHDISEAPGEVWEAFNRRTQQ